MTDYTISGKGRLPGGTAPLVGSWSISIVSSNGVAFDSGGDFRAATQTYKTKADGTVVDYDGSDNVTLPETTDDFVYQAIFVSSDRWQEVRLGPFLFELTADATWQDVIETPSIIPTTPANVTRVEELADQVSDSADQVAADRAAVEGVVATSAGVMASVDANAGSAFRVQQDARQAAAYGALQKVAATVTASGAAVVSKHNPVDATGGAKSISLPTGQTGGVEISVEKTDSSINTVSITGNIRGVAAQTVTLSWAHETLTLRADAAGSWWPVSGHKTKASLDAAYAALIVAGQGIPRTVNRADYATLALAIAAAGSGGVVWYPDNSVYNEPATTLSLPITIDAARASIRKSANGALFTITAASVKITSGLTIDGNASNFTGPGIVVTGNGTTSDLVLDCHVINCHQWAVDVSIGAAQRGVFGKSLFATSNKTASDAAMTAGSAVLTSATAGFVASDLGKYALVRGALTSAHTTWYLISKIVSVDSATQVTLADSAGRTVTGELLEFHFPSFRFGAEQAAGVTGDRHMIGTHTGGYLLADIGGCQTLDMVSTNSRGLIFSSAACAKISGGAGNRFATSGGTTFIRGINHSFVGATFAGDIVLASDSSVSVVKSNIAGDVFDYGTLNTVEGQATPFPPHTAPPHLLNSLSALAASQAVYMRVKGRGFISKIRLHVGVSSGNIAVAVYSSSGAGTLAVPATRKATSGSVACPAAGAADVSLTSSVYVEEGDWICLVADNTTATFYRGTVHAFNTTMGKGFCASENSAFPPPTTASPTTTAVWSLIMLGVA